MSDEPELPVYVRSMFGAKSRQPLVTLVVGERMVQMPPTKAREIAMMLLECAEAAQTDGFLIRFLGDRLGIEEARTVQLLAEFRKTREES